MAERRAPAQRLRGAPAEAAAPPEEALARAQAALHRRGGCVVLLGIAGVVIAYESLKRPADVHNPNAVFKPEKPKKPRSRRPSTGRSTATTAARTRYLPAKGVRPPFSGLWRYTERPLLEFPPVYAAGRLYFVNNNGYAFALDADTGKAALEAADRPPQRLLAGLLTSTASTSSTSSPATSSSSTRGPAGRSGNARCRAGRSPRRWSSAAPSTSAAKTATSTRSAPATATCAGRPARRRRSSRRPPTTAAYLYVGDYGGYMNAVNAKTGKLKWQSG